MLLKSPFKQILVAKVTHEGSLAIVCPVSAGLLQSGRGWGFDS